MGLTISPSQVQINEEGVSQGTASILNFVSNATTVTVSNGTATVTDLAPTIGIELMIRELNYNI